MPDEARRATGWKPVPLLAGPLAMLVVELLAGPHWPQGPMLHVASLALWMCIWWVTEAVPLPVTAMLPFIGFPLTGVMSSADCAATYFNSTVFLFIGGFLMAFALERWEMHRTIAAAVLRLFGRRPQSLLLGLMLATAFISMWMSNTAVAILMLPVALALCDTAGQQGLRGLAPAVVLGVIYSASIGGLGTPLGSPPNLVFLQIHAMSFPDSAQPGFLQWMLFCVPLMLALLLCCWALLARNFLRHGAAEIPAELLRSMQLGSRPGREQWTVGLVFCATALLWLSRAPLGIGALQFSGWGVLFADGGGRMLADDGTVAVLAALLLFVLPAGRASGGGGLLRWEDAQRIPWGIVLLFGGGFALAEGVIGSGLSHWAGERMLLLAVLPPLLMVVLAYGITTILGELASNTAIAQILLPVTAGLAISAGLPPLLLMLPVTLGSSLDFVLPSATPPNAIGLATGQIDVRMLVRNGLLMELISTLLVTAAIWLLGGPVLGIRL
ncbi:MAG: DASS family sodium-coupled anion symporter [bacterium]